MSTGNDCRPRRRDGTLLFKLSHNPPSSSDTAILGWHRRAVKPANAHFLLLLLCAFGFAGLGLPDGILGIAWPSIRVTFGLPLDAVGALLVATTCGYVASSFSSGAILARMTVGMLLALSCLATSLSLYGYTFAPSWWLLVSFGVVAGLGAGAIDAGINTFVATHYAARVLTLLHAFYGLGTACGPVIMTAVLSRGASWRRGYAFIAAAQFALALAFGLTLRFWPPSAGVARREIGPPVAATLRMRAVRYGIATFFFYVGIEAAANVWIYSLLHDSRGVSMTTAGAAVSLYWIALLVGRVLFAVMPAAVSPNTVLWPCMLAVAGAALLLSVDLAPKVDLAAIALLGMAAGPIFPALMATTPLRLDERHTANAVGFQVAAAALGQSLLPAAVGMVASAWGLEQVGPALFLLALLMGASFGQLDRVGPVAAVRPVTSMG